MLSHYNYAKLSYTHKTLILFHINALGYFRCHSVIVSKCQNRFWGFHSLLYKNKYIYFYIIGAILHRKMKMTL